MLCLMNVLILIMVIKRIMLKAILAFVLLHDLKVSLLDKVHESVVQLRLDVDLYVAAISALSRIVSQASNLLSTIFAVSKAKVMM